MAEGEIEVGMPAARSGGFFLDVRMMMLCQSIGCMSTLKPAFSISRLATGARLVCQNRSLDCSSTTGVPS